MTENEKVHVPELMGKLIEKHEMYDEYENGINTRRFEEGLAKKWGHNTGDVMHYVADILIEQGGREGITARIILDDEKTTPEFKEHAHLVLQGARLGDVVRTSMMQAALASMKEGCVAGCLDDEEETDETAEDEHE